MDGTQILTLGLGLGAPRILKDQHLDTLRVAPPVGPLGRRRHCAGLC